MQNRLRLLMGANTLLYFGPLLAGLGGYGWEIVPVFAAIFMLWLVILRPQDWPQSFDDWRLQRIIIAVAARMTVQLLLVTMLFGIGRGIGGALGTIAAFPLMLPIAVSFLSIPLARLVWDPRKAAEADAIVAKALEKLAAANLPIHPRDAAARISDGILAPLYALPDTVEESVLDQHLAVLAKIAPPESIRDALVARAQGGTATRAAVKALIVLATSPALAESIGGDMPNLAFAAAGTDPELLELFARRCAALLEQDDDIWPECPPVRLISHAADITPNPVTAAALRHLAQVSDRVAPYRNGAQGAA